VPAVRRRGRGAEVLNRDGPNGRDVGPGRTEKSRPDFAPQRREERREDRGQVKAVGNGDPESIGPSSEDRSVSGPLRSSRLCGVQSGDLSARIPLIHSVLCVDCGSAFLPIG